MTNFTQPVVTSVVDPSGNLVGFQGDFIFDSSVVTFQNPPVGGAGLTSGNWNISGTILSGPGTTRTLHISATSNDLTPLAGAGTLFNLQMVRATSTPGATTALTWAPTPDHFVYIDGNLVGHAPNSTPPGAITVQGIMSISGAISYCANPLAAPVPDVSLHVTGDATLTIHSDDSGNYLLAPLLTGGTYTVTPTKRRFWQARMGLTRSTLSPPNDTS